MPRIFIVYRQTDSGAVTRQIADYLARSFGANQIVTVAQEAPPGIDLRDDVRRLANDSPVVISVMGQAWGQDPRLQNPNDFVRIALETALNNPYIRVLPVLVNGAMMPVAQVLPPTLEPLIYRGSTGVRNAPYFDQDMVMLAQAINRLLQATPPPTPASPQRMPQQPLPQPQPIVMMREGSNGCVNIPLRIVSSILGFIASLFATIIRQMLASVVGFIMGIVIFAVVGGVGLVFIASLVSHNFDIGLAIGGMGQQFSQIVAGLTGK